jgi:hypothetical protein
MEEISKEEENCQNDCHQESRVLLVNKEDARETTLYRYE